MKKCLVFDITFNSYFREKIFYNINGNLIFTSYNSILYIFTLFNYKYVFMFNIIRKLLHK
jgi:hypothetical protein